MKTMSSLLLWLSLTALLAAGPVERTDRDLCGWLGRLLAVTGEQGARFNSLSVSVEKTVSPGQPNGRVEIRTPERLYRFGQVLALAEGTSDNHRNRDDRTWNIDFPVTVETPTLRDAELESAPETQTAVARLRERFSGLPDAKLTQLQLRRVQSLPSLAGMGSLPFTVTLAAPSARLLVDAVGEPERKQPLLGLLSGKLSSAGASTLGTYHGKLLCRIRPTRADRPTRESLEAAVHQVLDPVAPPPFLLQYDLLQSDSARIRFEAVVKGLPEAWSTLESLLALPALVSHEILEVRVDTQGRVAVSGLLYF
ncbi:MAG: hypothetical protein HY814_10305 [Candidatus Riflebacteria bacterium]|nr:hypothetical protein [Candidatus Riflebacteria bacterium]